MSVTNCDFWYLNNLNSIFGTNSDLQFKAEFIFNIIELPFYNYSNTISNSLQTYLIMKCIYFVLEILIRVSILGTKSFIFIYYIPLCWSYLYNFLYFILDCNCPMKMCCGLCENQLTLESNHTLAKLV